jgi:hypothetical protein
LGNPGNRPVFVLTYVPLKEMKIKSFKMNLKNVDLHGSFFRVLICCMRMSYLVIKLEDG